MPSGTGLPALRGQPFSLSDAFSLTAFGALSNTMSSHVHLKGAVEKRKPRTPSEGVCGALTLAPYRLAVLHTYVQGGCFPHHSLLSVHYLLLMRTLSFMEHIRSLFLIPFCPQRSFKTKLNIQPEWCMLWERRAAHSNTACLSLNESSLQGLSNLIL